MFLGRGLTPLQGLDPTPYNMPYFRVTSHPAARILVTTVMQRKHCLTAL